MDIYITLWLRLSVPSNFSMVISMDLCSLRSVSKCIAYMSSLLATLAAIEQCYTGPSVCAKYLPIPYVRISCWYVVLEDMM